MIRIVICKNKYCNNKIEVSELMKSCEVKCPLCLGFTEIPKNESDKQNPTIDLHGKKW
jgi:hypothetical protein